MTSRYRIDLPVRPTVRQSRVETHAGGDVADVVPQQPGEPLRTGEASRVNPVDHRGDPGGSF